MRLEADDEVRAAQAADRHSPGEMTREVDAQRGPDRNCILERRRRTDVQGPERGGVDRQVVNAATEQRFGERAASPIAGADERDLQAAALTGFTPALGHRLDHTADRSAGLGCA